MSKLKLTLHPHKTRGVDMGQEGFDFLGFPFHKLRAKKSNKLVPYMWPGQKAMKAVRGKIRQITARIRLSNPLTEVVKHLNRVIQGWRNYFHRGNSSQKFQDLDRYVWQRLRQWVRSQGAKGAERPGVLESLLKQSGLEYFIQKEDAGQDLERPKMKVVGEPDEGKPHVRFEVAGDENQNKDQGLRHSQRKRRANGSP